MATTPEMNLVLPTVSVTLGPAWATQINEAFERIDEHDHSSGSGVQVKSAGLDINANLDIQSNKLFNLFSSQYISNVTPLTGASNAQSVSVSGGNLYYTNSSGVAVQLTSGGSIVSSPGAVETVAMTSVNTDVVINPADTFVYLIVDTTSSRTITLPLANAVSTGRIYIIKDASGLSNTNPITVVASGSDTVDGVASKEFDSNWSTHWFIGDGISSWYVS